MERWAILYDGDCGLCAWLLSGVLAWDRRERLRPVAIQDDTADALLAGLDVEQRLASWHLVSPAGERWSAGAAFPPLLRLLPGGAAPAALLARVPRATERTYRLVAANRTTLGRLLPAAAKQRAKRRIS